MITFSLVNGNRLGPLDKITSIETLQKESQKRKQFQVRVLFDSYCNLQFLSNKMGRGQSLEDLIFIPLPVAPSLCSLSQIDPAIFSFLIAQLCFPVPSVSFSQNNVIFLMPTSSFFFLVCSPTLLPVSWFSALCPFPSLRTLHRSNEGR